MTHYKNSRIEEEMLDDDMRQDIEDTLNTPEPETQEEKTFKKRFADQTRWFQEKEAKYKEELLTLKSQIEKISSGEIRPPKSEAEVIAWEKEYPDFSQIMDARVERIVEGKLKDHKTIMNEVKRDKALLGLKKAVAKDNPDVDVDTLLDPSSKFHDWLQKQSTLIQNAIYKSQNVNDAADVIDRYVNKVLRKKKSGDDDYGSAAKAVRTKGHSPSIDDDGREYLYTESQVKKMSDREWDTHGEKVQKAMREGKVLLDITGGAR